MPSTRVHKLEDNEVYKSLLGVRIWLIQIFLLYLCLILHLKIYINNKVENLSTFLFIYTSKRKTNEEEILANVEFYWKDSHKKLNFCSVYFN